MAAPRPTDPPPATPRWRWPWVDAARAQVQRFWLSRLQPTDTVFLNQRNVYILPTWAGLMLATTLAVLLLASINYQLNLGYALTFLLTGCALVGMQVGHATLRGLQLQFTPPPPCFAGSSTALTIQLHSARARPRFGIGLALHGSTHWSWTDVPAHGTASVVVHFTPTQRGFQAPPVLTAETRYPLGSFRVWTVWRAAAQLLVYPAAEAAPPPLPGDAASETGERPAGLRSAAGNGDFDGVRMYRRGDPRKLVLWKKLAKSDQLVSRNMELPQHRTLWLDLLDCGLPAGSGALLEQRLSRLCAWVLAAHQQQRVYGLRLPGLTLAPGSGPAQHDACLQALALYQQAP